MWTSAFQLFVGIHTSKFPQDAPALMKYYKVVRGLAARGANWQFNDRQFRYMRQSQLHDMPWGVNHFELWVRAQSFNRNIVNRPRPRESQSSPSGIFVPLGFCRVFHRGFKCSGCFYKHTCFKFVSQHPAKGCNFRPSGKFHIAGKSATTAQASNPFAHVARWRTVMT